MAKTNTKTVNPRQRAIDTVNAIRSKASAEYQAQIPRFESGADYTTAMQSIVEFTPFYNEFVSGLVNRIIFTQIQRQSFSNPLQVFHRGGYPLGTDIQNIYFNPSNAKAYDMNSGATGLFETVAPDAKVTYFRRNRQDKYKVTIPREVLAGGFTRWEQLDDFIQQAIASTYSGNSIDEFNLCKKVFATGVANNAIVTDDSIEYTSNDEVSATQLARLLRTYYGKFKFPSSSYNAYGPYARANGVEDATDAITWVENNDVVTLIRSDVLSDLDMYVEAQAFNLDKARLLGNVIEVDTFEYIAGNDTQYIPGTVHNELEKCLAIILDRKAVQVFDNLKMAGDFFNIDDLKHHYYLHVWQTYGLNLCANCVAILDGTV